MARMTARYYGPSAGWIAAFALNVTAYYGVAAATFALPDGPLVFFWLLDARPAPRGAREAGRAGPWIWVGLAWGGAMLSKYQAVFLPIATLAYLVIEPTARHWLRRPGPYVAFVLGLVVFAPVISWNVDHGWASFAFQGGRALGSSSLRPDRFAAFIAGQAAYLFPWLWVPLIVVLFREVRGLRTGRRAGFPGRFLTYQAVVPLLAFGGIALVQPVLPHWSLVGFLAAFPLLGRAWAKRMEAAPTRFVGRLSILAMLSGCADGARGDPRGNGLAARGEDDTAWGWSRWPATRRLDFYGWDQVSRDLERAASSIGPSCSCSPIVGITADTWRSRPIAASRWPATTARHAQNFAYWSDPRDWVGRDGIFVGVNDCEHGGPRHVAVVPPLRADRHVSRSFATGFCIRVVHLYRGVDQTAPFPFGNARKAAPQRHGSLGPEAAAIRLEGFRSFG